MEKDLMPNLKENIVDDFYLTPVFAKEHSWYVKAGAGNTFVRDIEGD